MDPREELILPEDLKAPNPDEQKKSDEEAQLRQQENQRIEQQATNMGWSPKERWRGDPEKWLPADKFVERGRTLMPILQERLDSAHGEIKELRDTINKFGEYHKRTLESERKRHIEELQEARKRAFQEQDADAFEEADRKLAEARAGNVDAPAGNGQPEERQPKAVFTKEDFDAWKSDNKWHGSDPELESYADAMALYVKDTAPHLSGRMFLEEVTKQVMNRFPQKFSNPAREGATDVSDAGSEYRGPANTKKSYIDLPSDAKRECDRFVKQGLLTRDQFVRDYFSQGSLIEYDESA